MEVTVMAAADHGGPGPDHYQLLGVARGASREEIAQAWRRWPCPAWPGTGTGPGGTGTGHGESGVGGHGPGPVQHLGGCGAGRAASADAADLRAGRAAGPGPERGRDPALLPPGHRPAP